MNTDSISQAIIDEARAAVRAARASGDDNRVADAQHRLTIAESSGAFLQDCQAAGINMGARHG